MNVLQWIWWLSQGKLIGLYCSDVSGAFDKVSSSRLVQKLQNLGVSDPLLTLLSSWLKFRNAVVVVDGAFSEEALLRDMVYQGTVLGPPLWNSFFADARFVIQDCDFKDTFFADDLNCYKSFSPDATTKSVIHNLEECQSSLHA